MVLALAYFVAELWHGASRRDLAAGPVVAGASRSSARPLLWLLSRPLCGFVGVAVGQPGLAGLPGAHPDFVLTARTAGLTVVVAIGLVVLVLRFLDFDAGDGPRPRPPD